MATRFGDAGRSVGALLAGLLLAPVVIILYAVVFIVLLFMFAAYFLSPIFYIPMLLIVALNVAFKTRYVRDIRTAMKHSRRAPQGAAEPR